MRNVEKDSSLKGSKRWGSQLLKIISTKGEIGREREREDGNLSTCCMVSIRLPFQREREHGATT